MLSDRWNAKASPLEESTLIQTEVAQELLDRLELLQHKPQHLLEIGTGLPYFEKALYAQGFNGALTALSASDKRLEKRDARTQTTVWKSPLFPFLEESFDAIVTMLYLPFENDVLAFFIEALRVLKPGGVLLLASYGPDTFKELGTRSLTLIDMHDLGDRLLQAGLIEPIIDRGQLFVEYDDSETALSDLQELGEDTLLLTQAPLENFSRLSYEIIYGQAFAPTEQHFRADDKGEVVIPISKIKRRF